MGNNMDASGKKEDNISKDMNSIAKHSLGRINKTTQALSSSKHHYTKAEQYAHDQRIKIANSLNSSSGITAATAPSDLSKGAKKIWNYLIVECMKNEHPFKTPFLFSLKQFCILMDQFNGLNDIFIKGGSKLMIKTKEYSGFDDDDGNRVYDEVERLNPLVAEMKKYNKDLNALADILQITPKSYRKSAVIAEDKGGGFDF